MTVLGVLAIVAGFQWLQAERQRQSANAARQSAEGILNYLLNQLSAKLEPIGHLDVVQDVQKQDGFMKEGSIRSGYYLRPSKAMGSDGGPTGDSKIRWRIARAARNQRDFHHHVGLFERRERLCLEDREQDRPDRRIKVG